MGAYDAMNFKKCAMLENVMLKLHEDRHLKPYVEREMMVLQCSMVLQKHYSVFKDEHVDMFYVMV